MRTLSVRNMQCAEGFRLIRNLFRDNPEASSTPLNKKRWFETVGKVGTKKKRTRAFRCSLIYTKGSGDNAGGIALKINCHTSQGDTARYTE